MSKSELVYSVDRVVADVCGVHPEWMHQRIQKREIVEARQLAQVVLSFKRLSDTEIAIAYGQSRSTVIHAIRSMAGLIQVTPALQEKVWRICHKLEIPSDEFFRFCRMTPK